MTNNFIEERVDEAVRDICQVSVAPASKSKVKEILINLLLYQLKEVREVVGDMAGDQRNSVV